MRTLSLLLSLSLLTWFGPGCTKKSTEAVPGKLTGKIMIAPELAQKIKPSYVLFLIARNQEKGPPTAVKRFVKPQFPVEYTLGPEDSMMPGTPGFEAGAELRITARVSKSGGASASPGDFEGEYAKNPAHPGEAGVDVTIDREL